MDQDFNFNSFYVFKKQKSLRNIISVYALYGRKGDDINCKKMPFTK